MGFKTFFIVNYYLSDEENALLKELEEREGNEALSNIEKYWLEMLLINSELDLKLSIEDINELIYRVKKAYKRWKALENEMIRADIKDLYDYIMKVMKDIMNVNTFQLGTDKALERGKVLQEELREAIQSYTEEAKKLLRHPNREQAEELLDEYEWKIAALQDKFYKTFNVLN